MMSCTNQCVIENTPIEFRDGTGHSPRAVSLENRVGKSSWATHFPNVYPNRSPISSLATGKPGGA